MAKVTKKKKSDLVRSSSSGTYSLKGSSTKPCGLELCLDLKKCDPALFTRRSIGNYFTELCELIEAEKGAVYFWDEREGSLNTICTSAVCFIVSSSIVIHALDELKTVYINVFSWKKFDLIAVKDFSSKWFDGEVADWSSVNRT